MEYIIVGLGNPEPEYVGTRHNVGRMVLDCYRKKYGFSEWENRKELPALVSKAVVSDREITLLEPDEYMNNSGKAVAKYIKDKKEMVIIVVHDDIDLPIGSFRISYDRGAGGHKGVISVENSIKTKKFVRIRVGIVPVFLGKMRKPKGEGAVQRHVLKKFSKGESKKIEKVLDSCACAIEQILAEGHVAAMNKWN